MEDLIKACQQCDPKAQHQLYQQHVDRLYYVIYRYTKDTYYIENILQDVFIKIFNHLDSFDKTKASFNTWSTTIAIRESINHCKKRKLDFSNIEDYPAYNIVEAENTLSQLSADDILNVITSIEDKYRIIFNLYEMDGYTHDEIAQLMDISPGTSRSTLSRAKKLIREQLALLKLEHHG